MPIFSYTLRTADGSLKNGNIEAASTVEALQQLRTQGTPLKLIPATGKNSGEKIKFMDRFTKVGLKDRIIFTEQLAVMLKAGVTLVQALHGIAEETTSKPLAKILSVVVADVESGIPFSQALTKHPRTFSTIFCQMVKAAERTGDIPSVLQKLAIQQQRAADLQSKVKGALMYPAIISVLLVGVIIVVITFILPKLSTLFTESTTALPASTRFLLALSDFFIYRWYIAILAVLGVIGAFKLLVSNKKGQYFWDKYKMKFPVMGTFMKKTYMTRFCESFASLASSGVPIIDVFSIVKGVIGNSVYELEIQKISDDVQNGIRIATAIRKSKYFPPMVGQLVSVGEQSGDLAGIFEVLGGFFQKDVDAMAKNLSTLLEPVIMIVMGGAVGFILISILQPIYSLVNVG
jgi:type IV pilus assembly protein PilC